MNAACNRPLPHNLEAERAILGAVLRTTMRSQSPQTVSPSDFYRDGHTRLFAKMLTLASRGEAIDLVTLREELQRSSDLDHVGGPAHITALADGHPRESNVEHHAAIVRRVSDAHDGADCILPPPCGACSLRSPFPSCGPRSSAARRPLPSSEHG